MTKDAYDRKADWSRELRQVLGSIPYDRQRLEKIGDVMIAADIDPHRLIGPLQGLAISANGLFGKLVDCITSPLYMLLKKGDELSAKGRLQPQRWAQALKWDLEECVRFASEVDRAYMREAPREQPLVELERAEEIDPLLFRENVRCILTLRQDGQSGASYHADVYRGQSRGGSRAIRKRMAD